jgi:hypothetical protein
VIAICVQVPLGDFISSYADFCKTDLLEMNRMRVSRSTTFKSHFVHEYNLHLAAVGHYIGALLSGISHAYFGREGYI